MIFQIIKKIYDTILDKACDANNIDLVQYLISSNRCDLGGKNILHYFTFLIKFQNKFYYILFRACKSSKVKIVEGLVSAKGINLNLRNILYLFFL